MRPSPISPSTFLQAIAPADMLIVTKAINLVDVILSEGSLHAEAMEYFAGDNAHGNHEFQSIIMVGAMAIAASTCV